MNDFAQTRHCSASVAPTAHEAPKPTTASPPANTTSIVHSAAKTTAQTPIETAVQTLKRCAVYCRVSSDDRLAQEFNSIDAQREAGHAFIASQRAEG